MRESKPKDSWVKIQFVGISLTCIVTMVCGRILVEGTEKHCKFDKYIRGEFNEDLKLIGQEVKKEAWKSWENYWL